MRLLHAKTLEFEEFTGAEAAPKYAILSHTWGKPGEEVTYKDMQKRRGLVESRAGFEKIRRCASQTIKDGLEYFWIDTCCINRSSSTELSEAINSMFQWYQRAEVCYAYLIDVSDCPGGHTHAYYQGWLSTFKTSKWFTRGWTLQELIAPRRLVFYATSWTSVGRREALALDIEAQTGIPYHVLFDPMTLPATSVAQKMSWAARRQTHRPEDRAYCLMGLFGVNMPMLYGEGEKAFVRLQEEIIKTSDDMSVFAWTDPSADYSSFRGLLANSPSEFASCKDLRCIPQSTIPPYRTTNKGIEISAQLYPLGERHDENIAWLHGVLDVSNPSTPDLPVGIHVKRVGKNQYARVDSNKRTLLPDCPPDSTSPSLTTFFVRQQIMMEDPDLSRVSGISLHVEDTGQLEIEVQPRESWDSTASFISFRRPTPTAVLVLRSRFDQDQDSYTMRFDATRTWQELLGEDESWETTQVAQASVVRVLRCQKGVRRSRRHLFHKMEIAISLGVFNGELRLLMAVTANFW